MGAIIQQQQGQEEEEEEEEETVFLYSSAPLCRSGSRCGRRRRRRQPREIYIKKKISKLTSQSLVACAAAVIETQTHIQTLMFIYLVQFKGQVMSPPTLLTLTSSTRAPFSLHPY